jgi:hypothetical protein
LVRSIVLDRAVQCRGENRRVANSGVHPLTTEWTVVVCGIARKRNPPGSETVRHTMVYPKA